jgi:hypothetical protein
MRTLLTTTALAAALLVGWAGQVSWADDHGGDENQDGGARRVLLLSIDGMHAEPGAEGGNRVR